MDALALRDTLKRALAAAAHGSGVLGGVRAGRTLLHGSAVRIFGYHRIVERLGGVTGLPPLCVTTATFAAQLDHLARHYEVWPLRRAVDALAGRRALPYRDVAVITFDDGYRDVATFAAPLLAARGLPASMFIATRVADRTGRLAHDELFVLLDRVRKAGLRLLGLASAATLGLPATAGWPLARADFALSTGAGDVMGATDALLEALPAGALAAVMDAVAGEVGRPGDDELAPTLDWDEIRRLDANGWTIGAHAARHTMLPLEPDDVLADELAGSRAAITRELGTPPAAVAYPAGRYDERVVAATRAAGFTIAVTTEDHDNRAGAEPLLLGRKVLCEGHGADSRALVAAHLDGLFATLGLSRLEPGNRRIEGPCLI